MAVLSGSGEAPASATVMSTFKIETLPPASDQNSRLRVPSGPTSRKSRSSGLACVKPEMITLTCVIWPASPLTERVCDGVEKSGIEMPDELVKTVMAAPLRAPGRGAIPGGAEALRVSVGPGLAAGGTDPDQRRSGTRQSARRTGAGRDTGDTVADTCATNLPST